MAPLRFPVPTLPFCREFSGYGIGAKLRIEATSYHDRKSGFEVEFLGNGEDVPLSASVSFEGDGRGTLEAKSRLGGQWTPPVVRVAPGLLQDRPFMMDIIVTQNSYQITVGDVLLVEILYHRDTFVRDIRIAGALVVGEISIFPAGDAPPPTYAEVSRSAMYGGSGDRSAYGQATTDLERLQISDAQTGYTQPPYNPNMIDERRGAVQNPQFQPQMAFQYSQQGGFTQPYGGANPPYGAQSAPYSSQQPMATGASGVAAGYPGYQPSNAPATYPSEGVGQPVPGSQQPFPSSVYPPLPASYPSAPVTQGQPVSQPTYSTATSGSSAGQPQPGYTPQDYRRSPSPARYTPPPQQPQAGPQGQYAGGSSFVSSGPAAGQHVPPGYSPDTYNTGSSTRTRNRSRSLSPSPVTPYPPYSGGTQPQPQQYPSGVPQGKSSAHSNPYECSQCAASGNPYTSGGGQPPAGYAYGTSGGAGGPNRSGSPKPGTYESGGGYYGSRERPAHGTCSCGASYGDSRGSPYQYGRSSPTSYGPYPTGRCTCPECTKH